MLLLSVGGVLRIANSEDDRTPGEVEEWIVGIAKTYPSGRVCTVEEIVHGFISRGLIPSFLLFA